MQRDTFYKCGLCKMYHRVGFVAQRDAELIWKEVFGKMRLVEPPQFVWRTLPSGAREDIDAA